MSNDNAPAISPKAERALATIRAAVRAAQAAQARIDAAFRRANEAAAKITPAEAAIIREAGGMDAPTLECWDYNDPASEVGVSARTWGDCLA
jgi:hypothetical protein